MQSVRNFLNKIVAYLLVFTMIVPIFLQFSTVEVKAASTSQDVVKAYMGLMQGKKISALQDDLKNLNENDLKVISLFLSNFYTPFGTSLEETSSGTTYTECVNILQSMNFDADAAKTLVSTCFQCALSYRSPLLYCADGEHGVNENCEKPVSALGLGDKGEYGDKPYINSGDADYLRAIMGDESGYHDEGGTTYYPLTIFTFWAILSGFNSEFSGGNPSIWFYKLRDDGSGVVDTSVPVFKINHAFSVIYGDLLDDERVYTNGRLCNAMWNGETDENAFTEANAFKLTPFGEALYVDWCGDVYADMGDRRVIVVPAVLNMAGFYTFDEAKNKTFITYLGSSFGLRIINHTQEDQLGMSYNKKAVEDFYRKRRGSHDIASWDTSNKGNDAGWAGDLEFMLKQNGVETNEGDNNDWDANRCFITMTSDSYATLSSSFGDNVVWDFLSYDAKLSDKTVIGKDSFSKADPQGNPWAYKDKYLIGGQTAFTNLQDEYNTIVSIGGNDTEIFRQLLLTYVYLFAQGKDSELLVGTFGEDDAFPYAFHSAKVFPESQAQVEFPTTNVTSEEIQSFLYLLLHPTEGIDYFVTWVKGKIAGLFVSWHEDIVGNTHTNVTTGMTKYIGFSGYVTIPSLHDVSFLNWMVTNYDLIVIYLVLVMFAVLMCYVLVGQLEMKRAFAGLIIFTVLAFLPTRVIEGSLSLINTISDTLYSSKFDYWAIVQNQEYLSILSEDIANLYTANADLAVAQKALKSEGNQSDNFTSSTQSVSLVRVKWPSPKRCNDIYRLQDELTTMNEAAGNVFTDTFLSIVTNTINSQNQAEEFVDDSTFLYRNYMDIYGDAMITYNVLGCNQGHSVRGKGFDYDGAAYSNDKISLGSGVIGKAQSEYTWNVPDSLKTSDKAPDYLKVDRYSASYDSGMNLLPVFYANADYSNAEVGLKDTTSIFAISKGFLYSNVPSNDNNYYGYKSLATSLLMKQSGKIVGPATKSYIALMDTAFNGLKLNKSEMVDENNLNKVLYGIDSRNFNYSTNEILIGHFKGGDKRLDARDSRNVTNADKLGYLYYTLYSESPYYFFNYNTRDQIRTIQYDVYDTNGHGGTRGYAFDYEYMADTQMEESVCNVKNMFLQYGEGNYFYNYNEYAGDGYGYMRDYMNMHDFFYYIMPILRQGNRSVRLFDDLYRLELYEDCSYKLDTANSIYYDGVKYPSNSAIFSQNPGLNTEDVYKLWHNMNMYTVFNMYTPWLDVMYDCDYAKPETIRVAGEDFYVQNPLDPTCYFTMENGKLTGGRYMVFSESEQHYYGLKDSDLTDVERHIINVQKNVYSKTLDLMNYYTLNDETLMQAYSMIQLFEFNKEFSQKNIVSSVFTLYPQGFELKTFTFDAYLRLIMAGSSSNIDLMSADSNGNSGSIYTQIMKNTSIFYGIFLLINDVLCVYIIPLLRFVFIVIVFIMSVAMIIFGAIKLYDDTGMTMTGILWQSLVKPIIQFTLISVGLAFIVSLLMFGGPSGVTSTTQTISLGDPTMTLILLIVLNSAVIVLYWKLVMSSYKELTKYLRAIASSVTGAVRGAIGTVAKLAIGAGVVSKFKKLANGQIVNGLEGDGVASGTAGDRGRRNTGIGGSTGGGPGGGNGLGLGTGGLGGPGGGAGGAGGGAGAVAAGGALAGLAGEDPAAGGDALGSGNSKLEEAFAKMNPEAKDKVDKEGLSDSINKSRQNVQDKHSELQSAKSKYDDYKNAKAEKHAKSHTGKYEQAKERLGSEGANFKEAATAFKNSKGAAKGTAFANMVGSGARQVSNGLSAAKEGVMSAPSRFVKEKVGKHFGGGFIDGMVHAKENNLKNGVANAQKAYDSARDKHSRRVDVESRRLNRMAAQPTSVEKSIARHNAKVEKRGTGQSQAPMSNVVSFSVAKNQKAARASRA